MNRADVIRLGEEAGFNDYQWQILGPTLERFAFLVEAETLKAHQQAIEAAVLAERDRVIVAIQREIDHAVTNDHRLMPRLGRVKGVFAVQVENLESAIHGVKIQPALGASA